MSKKDQVLVIGSMNFDLFYSLPRQMRLGENLHAKYYQTALGGKGANQAVQCAKLNLPTMMLGCLGKDNQGDLIYAGMSNHGVDMSHVLRVSEPTGNASIWVYPDGQVQAAIFGGANMCFTKELLSQFSSLISDCQVVILQNEIPMDVVEQAVQEAKRADCYVIYNAAPALEVSSETLEAVDLLVVNESEASFYSRTNIIDLHTAMEGAEQLQSMVKGDFIITLGHLGSLLVRGKKTKHLPTFPVQAVETTGAGDSYVGALAYGIISGQTLEEAALTASKTAAITVLSPGAQQAMPTLSQLKGFFHPLGSS